MAQSPKNHSEVALLLMHRAEAAVREKNQDAARRLLKAALRHDPANDQALLWMIYLAEDGQASLAYLARLLDTHPEHPQARGAIRWARRRIPTSELGDIPYAEPKKPLLVRHSREFVVGLALLTILLGLRLLWQLGKSPADPVQADASLEVSTSTLPASAARRLMEIVRVAIPLFTATPTATPIPTATPTPLPTPSAAWVPVVGAPQTYNLSCESRSAADLAGYWGIEISELQFFSALSRSDNPHKGFVGDVRMPPGSLPPYGYGVYAEPVAATLRGFGLDARTVYDFGLDNLKSELLNGRPVMVWATYGMELYEPIEWTSSDGQTSTVIPFMHTFLVTGFDETGLFVLDAYDATVQHYPYETFLDAWNMLDQMAMTVSDLLP